MNLVEAKNLALALMNKHGVGHWNFKFDRAKTSLGKCNYTSKTISLSMYYTELNAESMVRNTILHEIAHALTPGHHHDEVWRRKAIEIGCTGDRCTHVSERPKGKYVAYCKGCGHEFHMHRQPKAAYRCAKCPSGSRLEFQLA